MRRRRRPRRKGRSRWDSTRRRRRPAGDQMNRLFLRGRAGLRNVVDEDAFARVLRLIAAVGIEIQVEAIDQNQPRLAIPGRTHTNSTARRFAVRHAPKQISEPRRTSVPARGSMGDIEVPAFIICGEFGEYWSASGKEGSSYLGAISARSVVECSPLISLHGN